MVSFKKILVVIYCVCTLIKFALGATTWMGSGDPTRVLIERTSAFNCGVISNPILSSF